MLGNISLIHLCVIWTILKWNKMVQIHALICSTPENAFIQLNYRKKLDRKERRCAFFFTFFRFQIAFHLWQLKCAAWITQASSMRGWICFRLHCELALISSALWKKLTILRETNFIFFYEEIQGDVIFISYIYHVSFCFACPFITYKFIPAFYC